MIEGHIRAFKIDNISRFIRYHLLDHTVIHHGVSSVIKNGRISPQKPSFYLFQKFQGSISILFSDGINLSSAFLTRYG